MAESSRQQDGRGDIAQAEVMGITSAMAASHNSFPWGLPTAQRRWLQSSKGDWDTHNCQQKFEEKAAEAKTEEPFNDVYEHSREPHQRSEDGTIDPALLDHLHSRLDTNNGPPTASDAQHWDQPEDSSSPHRESIEDRIREMELGNSVDLPWINDRDADTWVFIDAAPQQPEQNDHLYKAYVERYQKPLLIKSITLKRLQSSFFDKLLSPSCQYRTLRRRGLVGKLPTQIKYVIDLTPPTEGDEAAWLMSELSCIEGLRDWGQSEKRWQISKTLVGGQDEFTSPLLDAPKNTRCVPEISPIRHRACIERVLNAIRDIDPNLDSAVKVYTTFVVARFFDVIQNRLTDYIVRWLRAPPNSLFIEAFPEVALKIGDGLQCSELIRDSFAILVGEEALELTGKKQNADRTLWGRKKNDIPESYKTRIEYASKNLQDRVSQVFEVLVERDMTWMESLREFKKLLNHDDQSMAPLLTETQQALKAFVRGAIFAVLYGGLTWAPKLWLGSEAGDCLYPRNSQHNFWNGLEPASRKMTNTFWQALKQSCTSSFTNFPNSTNLNAWARSASGWGFRLRDAQLKILMQSYGVTEIPYSYLQVLTSRCKNGQAKAAPTNSGFPNSLNHHSEALASTTTPTSYENADRSLNLAEESSVLFGVSADDSQCAQLDPGDKLSLETSAYPSAVTPHLHQPRACSNPYGVDVSLTQLVLQINDHIMSVCGEMTSPPDADRREPMNMDMTPTLVCLDQSEWKYLPLYAGGLDDGSGGVFNDDVPMADYGFSTAGPRVHTGTGSSTASSELEFVERQDLGSTQRTSTMTNDGISDSVDHWQGQDSNSDLWEEIMRKKEPHSERSASGVETKTVAVPSTIGAESEDGFVLPIRKKEPANSTFETDETHATSAQNGNDETATNQDTYDDIFEDSDEELDEATNNVNADDDDDASTEKGEDDDGLSDDEDLVLV